MHVQVYFLKVLFKTWINHFFQNSTEISSDGRLKTLITFRLTTFRLVSTLLGRSHETLFTGYLIRSSAYLLSCVAFSVLIRNRWRNLSVAKLVYVSPKA